MFVSYLHHIMNSNDYYVFYLLISTVSSYMPVGLIMIKILNSNSEFSKKSKIVLQIFND